MMLKICFFKSISEIFLMKFLFNKPVSKIMVWKVSSTLSSISSSNIMSLADSAPIFAAGWYSSQTWKKQFGMFPICKPYY